MLYARLRYFLEGDRPSQTNNHLVKIFFYIVNILNVAQPLRYDRDLPRGSYTKTSYTYILQKIIVKVHRVFPSSRIKSHLHDYFNFMESILETVGQSLRRSY